MTREEFLSTVDFLLNSTYFVFNKKFYKQILGAAKGFCTSPWFTELVMELLEIHALNIMKCSIILKPSYLSKTGEISKFQKLPVLLFKKYVDDIFDVVHKDFLNQFLHAFNSFNEHLKFTLEIEDTKNSINFLNITIYRKPNEICTTNWYTKPIFSGRYLPPHFPKTSNRLRSYR